MPSCGRLRLFANDINIHSLGYQEYVLTDNEIFLDPEVNILGASAMVSINKLADWLNDFPMLNPDLQTGIPVYS